VRFFKYNTTKENPSVEIYSDITELDDNLIICGYFQHAMTQIYRWDGEKYIE